MQTVEITHKDKKYQVPTVRVGLELWYHFEGVTHKYEIPSKCKASAGSSGDEENGVFTSPMPGKVMKVNVKESDKVKSGQVLLVLEAMKMEYSIEAPFDGVVESLSCEADQQVSLGDLLVKINRD